VLKILKVVPLPDIKTVQAGQVVALPTLVGEGPKPGFGVSTNDGVLGVLKVQLEGKRAMSAAEFLRGQRQFIDAVLPC
jgi:methionyl-tRNA formyltransferase